MLALSEILPDVLMRLQGFESQMIDLGPDAWAESLSSELRCFSITCESMGDRNNCLQRQQTTVASVQETDRIEWIRGFPLRLRTILGESHGISLSARIASKAAASPFADHPKVEKYCSNVFPFTWSLRVTTKTTACLS